jgi:hypothetical protein
MDFFNIFIIDKMRTVKFMSVTLALMLVSSMAQAQFVDFGLYPPRIFVKTSVKNGVNMADIRLKTPKRGIIWAFLGGGGIGFRTIPAHLRKAVGFGIRFRTIPAQF